MLQRPGLKDSCWQGYTKCYIHVLLEVIFLKPKMANFCVLVAKPIFFLDSLENSAHQGIFVGYFSPKTYPLFLCHLRILTSLPLEELHSLLSPTQIFAQCEEENREPEKGLCVAPNHPLLTHGFSQRVT